MWQSWVCSICLALLSSGWWCGKAGYTQYTWLSYPVVGDVTKLDICLYAFHGLFVLMRQQSVNSVITYFVCSSSSVCMDYHVCRFTPDSCQLLLPDHLIAGFVTCLKLHDYTIGLFTYSTRAAPSNKEWSLIICSLNWPMETIAWFSLYFRLIRNYTCIYDVGNCSYYSS